MINTEPGYKHIAYDKMWDIDGVKEAYKVLGVYDIILRIEINELEALSGILSAQIRTMKEVLSTLTLIILNN